MHTNFCYTWSSSWGFGRFAFISMHFAKMVTYSRKISVQNVLVWLPALPCFCLCTTFPSINSSQFPWPSAWLSHGHMDAHLSKTHIRHVLISCENTDRPVGKSQMPIVNSFLAYCLMLYLICWLSCLIVFCLVDLLELFPMPLVPYVPYEHECAYIYLSTCSMHC